MVSQAGDNEGGGEQKVVQSNIKKDERFDVRWEGMPFKHRKIGRGPKATYEKVCIMPLWLRNLWPTSEFDPCAVWEQAKEDEAEEEVERGKAAAASAASGKGSKGGSKSKKGGGGGGKLSKKETIQAEQAKKRAEVGWFERGGDAGSVEVLMELLWGELWANVCAVDGCAEMACTPPAAH